MNNKTISSLLVFAAILNLVTWRVFAQSTVVSSEKDIKLMEEQVNERLKFFVKLKDVEEMEQANETIKTLWTGQKDGVKNWKDLRAAQAKLWLRLINHADQRIDPKFDINDDPVWNVSLPEGVPIPEEGFIAGQDPGAIKDPEIRRQYEEAIKKNEQENDRRRFQHGLRRMKEELLRTLKIHIENFYGKTVEELREIDQLMEAEISDKTKIAAIKSVIIGKAK